MIKFFTNEKSATWDFALTMIQFFVLFSVFETAKQPGSGLPWPREVAGISINFFTNTGKRRN